MATYDIGLYCPFDAEVFNISVEAPTAEMAKKKAIGMAVTCPTARHEFEIEELWITHIYPIKVLPTPPYELMPEKVVREAKWLKDSLPLEEPLPKDATPEGSPKLATIIQNALTSFIYEQPIKSKEYPEYKTTIKYRRDIFTKFYEEAKRMRRAKKIPEAIVYAVEHTPGISLRMLADALELGYWTTWRQVAEFARPTEEEMKKIMTLLDETASLEKWTDLQKQEVIIELKKTKPPKISVGFWRGQVTLYPIKPKTLDELLVELKRILTLEGYPKLSPEEEDEMRRQLHRYWQLKRREQITTFLAQE